MEIRKPSFMDKQKITHIAVAVTNDLATDQRVARTCQALAEAGYRVTLIGRCLPASPAMPDRPYATVRMRLLFKRSALFYAEYNVRLWLRLLFLHPDACFANDTDTLLASAVAARWMRKPLLFDAHELFPEVPELERRLRVRGVWRWIERRCLPHVKVAYTVCQSVAEEYHRRYGIRMHVVRNLPAKSGQPSLSSASPVSAHADAHAHSLLYQGAVNVGRGIREAIDALEWLPDCRLTIAGDGDTKSSLEAYAATVPWKERVHFLGRVSPEALRDLTSQADLGLCLLEDMGLNYRYALPNRVGDFIHAGVPLMATRFPEMERVIQDYGTGALVEPCPREKEGDDYRRYVRHLAEQIDQTLAFWQGMPKGERASLFARAQDDLCWEKEKNNLLHPLDAIF